jgi:hypothetical protein
MDLNPHFYFLDEDEEKKKNDKDETPEETPAPKGP